jgi:uncharacterized membrane protein
MGSRGLLGRPVVLRLAVTAGVLVCLPAGTVAAAVGPVQPAARVTFCRWTPQTLPTLPGGGLAEIRGVDAGGTVWAGYARPAGDGPAHAVLWRDGRIIDLGTAVDGAGAFDVNRSGVAVGQRLEGGVTRMPAMWRAGQSVALALPPGATGGAANGVNDAGLVVGEAYVAGATHAVVWSADDPGQVIDLGTGGSRLGRLNGVSESGVLAGETFGNGPATALTGTVADGLRTLAGTAAGSATNATAASGRFVVGFERLPSAGPTRPESRNVLLWDAGSPRVIAHGEFPADTQFPTAVNPAGLVAGLSFDGGLVWQGTVQTRLPATNGNTHLTAAYAVSDDGRVGGHSSPDTTAQPMATIWSCHQALIPTRPRKPVPPADHR